MGYTHADTKFVDIHIEQYSGMSGASGIVRVHVVFEFIPDPVKAGCRRSLASLVKVNKQWEQHSSLMVIYLDH